MKNLLRSGNAPSVTHGGNIHQDILLPRHSSDKLHAETAMEGPYSIVSRAGYELRKSRTKRAPHFNSDSRLRDSPCFRGPHVKTGATTPAARWRNRRVEKSRGNWFCRGDPSTLSASVSRTYANDLRAVNDLREVVPPHCTLSYIFHVTSDRVAKFRNQTWFIREWGIINFR